MISAGSQLGPYRILDRLGAGGMAEVYRARDLRLDRDVAVKVLPEPFTQDANRLARFEREAKAVAALAHPNILVLYDFGTAEGVCYAVTELLEGETLRGRMADGPLGWRKAAEIGAAIADGLAAAHAKGIVHRDLKPANLFVTTDGRVKILDFGLARLETRVVPSAETEVDGHNPADTQAGVVIGTVGYMSPEQIRGQAVDSRSDLFSLGCVLYEMIAGRRPFHAASASEVQAAILRDDPPPLAEYGRQVPPKMQRLIRRCLEKRPDERFQSARDLAFDLRALVADGDGHGPPASPAARRRRSLAIALALGLVLALGTAAGIVAFLNRNGQTPSAPNGAAGERFVPISLKGAAMACSDLPLVDDAWDRGNLLLDDWGPRNIDDVPFQLIDPREGTVPNVLLLYAPGALRASRMPKRVTVPVQSPATVIHLLGCVSGWGWPFPPDGRMQRGSPEGSVAVTVRLRYEDGHIEDHLLKNGEHLADYEARHDVPGSKFAFASTNGRQVRRLAIPPAHNAAIRELDFIKAEDDNTAPFFLAITVERP
jgi:protein kinase-like protein